VTDLVARATRVLESNWLGHATRPGPHLYPHQWSWDSAFVAIGLAHVAPDRARTELSSLFRAQWRNGLLPQIVFNPEAEAEYFPDARVWDTDRNPDAPFEPRTSGIVQPPVHALAVRELHRRAPDDEWLRGLLPGLRAWHDYLYRERDHDGLVHIRHPWESGMDDSPAWDPALARIALPHDREPSYRRVDLTRVTDHERPTNADYDHYVHLVEVFKRADYDEAKLRESCPFWVADPLFNAALIASDRALAELAQAVGESGPDASRALRTEAAMEQRLWSDRAGCFVAFDARAGEQLPARVAGGLAPLIAGVGDVERIVEELEAPSFWPADGWHPVPTADALAPAFERRRYWRGPVWANLNWLIWRGLRDTGHGERAHALRERTLDLVARGGLREYFDPTTGDGLGSQSFSWTAALAIDMAAAEP
jgi:glycogen debranching enzyme